MHVGLLPLALHTKRLELGRKRYRARRVAVAAARRVLGAQELGRGTEELVTHVVLRTLLLVEVEVDGSLELRTSNVELRANVPEAQVVEEVAVDLDPGVDLLWRVFGDQLVVRADERRRLDGLSTSLDVGGYS